MEVPPVPGASQPRLSVGSIGHPHSCAPACRYVKRQGGCREGVLCKQCHQCFWQRRATNPEEPGDTTLTGPCHLTEDAIIATVGDTEEGLGGRDRASHAVQLGEAGAGDEGASSSCAEVGGEGTTASIEALLSVGSEGHPQSCGPPCKYLRRRPGCREGTACQRCHLCQWRRGLPPKEGLADQRDKATSPGFTKESVETLKKLIQLHFVCQERMTTTDAGAAISAKSRALDRAFAAEALTPVDRPPGGRSPHGGGGGGGDLVPEWVQAADWYPWQSRCPPCAVEATAGAPVAEGSASGGEASRFPVETSIGSVGHPLTCQGACKYLRRKGGCRDGVGCTMCHHCQWTRRK